MRAHFPPDRVSSILHPPWYDGISIFYFIYSCFVVVVTAVVVSCWRCELHFSISHRSSAAAISFAFIIYWEEFVCCIRDHMCVSVLGGIRAFYSCWCMWFHGWSSEPQQWERTVFCCYYFRNSGNLYGGTLNLTHMGFYWTNDKLLSITFKETTIVRRLNVHGIQLRTMFVVGTSIFVQVK